MKKIYKFLLWTCLLSTMNAFGMDENSVGDNNNVNTPTVEQRNETEHQQNWWEIEEPSTIKVDANDERCITDIISQRVMRDYIRQIVSKKKDTHWSKTTPLMKESMDAIASIISERTGRNN